MDEVIERANDTKYGLASGVVTKNLNNALVFAQAVHAGSVWYAPFILFVTMYIFPLNGIKHVFYFIIKKHRACVLT